MQPPSRPNASPSQVASQHARVLHLQRTIGNTGTTALLTSPTLLTRSALTVQRQPKPPNPVEQAGRALRDFEAWADDQMKRQNVVDKAAVVGLDPKQASSVRAAAARLAGYAPTMLASANKADPSIASLQSAIALAKQASAKVNGDQADRAEAASLRKRSREAVTRARSQVSGIVAGIDVKGLVNNLQAIEAALDGGNTLAEILKYLNRTVTDLEKVRTEALARATSAKRIDVLLRGFLALNDPSSPAPPTAAEIADVRSQLSGGLQDEFVAVFDDAVDYDFFTEFANTWGQQLEAREQM
ncbi:MAG TPA: hypothetical protein VFU98_07645, partial [Microlunatus sp.]|nr:hypothetical protein [Microlunatus sp.]